MAIIFHKRIEKSDTTGSRMKFPAGDVTGLTNLPFSCNNAGQSGRLTVTDEGGTHEWTLTIENKHGQVCFTGGWKAFREEKGITVGHEISLCKDDETGLYIIKVGGN